MSTKTPVTGLTIPPELQRSLPREVALSGAGITVTVLAALLIIGSFVAGAVLFATSRSQSARYEAERAESATTVGRVTAVSRIPGKDDRWRVYYTYQHEGSAFSGASRMRRSDARQFQPGTEASIVYVRSDPGTSWVAGHEPESMPIFVPFFTAACLFMPGLALLWTVQHQRSLLERGRPALARVTTTRRHHQGQARSTVYLYYEFTDMSGAAQKGRGSVGKNKQAAPPPGSEVVIVYDADNPRRTALYPLQFVRVRMD